MRNLALFLLAPFCLSAIRSGAQPFQLPTANRAIYDVGSEERYFVPTVGKTWVSGTFGCVRSDGWQIHEGIDIKCLQRDKKGEPTDPVMATADGTVTYINEKSGLSNYGNYVVIKHRIEGLEIYSLYGHLRQVRDDLVVGKSVKAGDVIATMGRTTNTREKISQERAHVHFELNLLVNDRFASWYKSVNPDQRNDHGEWNGQNLLGLDPRLILLEEQSKGPKFSLLAFVQNQTELCRVFVRKTDFPWLKRYAPLVYRNPLTEKEGVAGYELALNFNGIPFQVIPRAPSEVKSKAKYQLLSVNAAEQKKNPARKLVSQSTGRWELAPRGITLLDQLTY